MLRKMSSMHSGKVRNTGKKLQQRPVSSQKGVAMLEALVSVLLFSMGVLALVGLQSAMVKNTSDSQYRAEASYIAQQWVGMMWANPDLLAAYLIPDNTDSRYDISTLLPNGTRQVTQPDPVNSPSQYQVTIKWQLPGQAQHTYTSIVYIVGG